jgi:hypothetical protein
LDAWRPFPLCQLPPVDWSPCFSKNLGEKLNLLKHMRFSLLIQSLKYWPILEIDHCMCIYLLKYDSETTGNVLDAVERWKFGSKQQKRVLHPDTLAERARYSLRRVMQFSTCCMWSLAPVIISLTMVSYSQSFSYHFSDGGDWFVSLTLGNCSKHLLNHSFIPLFMNTNWGFWWVLVDGAGCCSRAGKQVKASLSGGFFRIV